MQQTPFIKYISNEQHYNDVLSRVASVKRVLWIGTANIKDLYVKSGGSAVPLLAILNKLGQRGVVIRLIHSKAPGPAFNEELRKYPALKQNMEVLLCARVHFKLLVFDLESVYLGSANLTGAGMGMKSPNNRNFEAGVLTNEPTLKDAVITQFDNVWRGAYCQKCGRKKFCTAKMIK